MSQLIETDISFRGDLDASSRTRDQLGASGGWAVNRSPPSTKPRGGDYAYVIGAARKSRSTVCLTTTLIIAMTFFDISRNAARQMLPICAYLTKTDA